MCDTDSDEDHEENEVREENIGDCCVIISDDDEVSDECMDTEDIPPLQKSQKWVSSPNSVGKSNNLQFRCHFQCLI